MHGKNVKIKLAQGIEVEVFVPFVPGDSLEEIEKRALETLSKLVNEKLESYSAI